MRFFLAVKPCFDEIILPSFLAESLAPLIMTLKMVKTKMHVNNNAQRRTFRRAKGIDESTVEEICNTVRLEYPTTL